MFKRADNRGSTRTSLTHTHEHQGFAAIFCAEAESQETERPRVKRLQRRPGGRTCVPGLAEVFLCDVITNYAVPRQVASSSGFESRRKDLLLRMIFFCFRTDAKDITGFKRRA